MISVNEDKLKTNFDEIKSYLEYYNKYGQPLVDEYSKDLDSKVSSIQEYMSKLKEYNLEPDVVSLQRIVIELSSCIYYTNDKLEKLNLLSDMSKLYYKDVYNNAYLSKQVATTVDKRKYTTDQLRAHADNESLEENLINFIYSRAAAVLKGKIDSAYELLKATSKSLSGAITTMQQFNVGQRV